MRFDSWRQPENNNPFFAGLLFPAAFFYVRGTARGLAIR